MTWTTIAGMEPLARSDVSWIAPYGRTIFIQNRTTLIALISETTIELVFVKRWIFNSLSCQRSPQKWLDFTFQVFAPRSQRNPETPRCQLRVDARSWVVAPGPDPWRVLWRSGVWFPTSPAIACGGFSSWNFSCLASGKWSASERFWSPYSLTIFPIKNGEQFGAVRIELPNHLVVWPILGLKIWDWKTNHIDFRGISWGFHCEYRKVYKKLNPAVRLAPSCYRKRIATFGVENW